MYYVFVSTLLVTVSIMFRNTKTVARTPHGMNSTRDHVRDSERIRNAGYCEGSIGREKMREKERHTFKSNYVSRNLINN